MESNENAEGGNGTPPQGGGPPPEPQVPRDGLDGHTTLKSDSESPAFVNPSENSTNRGDLPPEDPTRVLDGIILDNKCGQLMNNKVSRVYSCVVQITGYFNNLPFDNLLKIVDLVSMRHSSVPSARAMKPGPQGMSAPIQTSSTSLKWLSNVAQKHQMLSSPSPMSDFNGVSYVLGQMVAQGSIGAYGQYSLRILVDSIDPSAHIGQLGGHATPFDSISSRVFVPRSLGGEYSSDAFWPLIIAIMKGGGSVTCDTLEAVYLDGGWRAAYPNLSGAALTSATLLAFRFLLSCAIECGDGSGVLLSFCLGIHSLLTVVGHTDEGGVLRDVFRTASFVPPYGVLGQTTTSIKSIPHVTMNSGAAPVRSVPDLFALLTAALVAPADPGTEVDGRRLPTVLGTSDDAEDEHGVILKGTQFEDLLRQLNKNVPQFCTNYIDLLCTTFGVIGRESGEIILRNCFDRFSSSAQRDNTPKHLRAGTCAPFFWIEPTGIVPVCLTRGKACDQWSGGPIGDRFRERVIPLIQEKKIDQVGLNMEALNFDVKWTNLRSNLLFAMFDQTDPTRNMNIILRSCDTQYVVYEGDRTHSRLDLASRMQQEASLYDLMWIKGENPFPAPAELLNGSKTPFGFESHLVIATEDGYTRTDWPGGAVFEKEKYEATVKVYCLRGEKNDRQSNLGAHVIRRGSWFSQLLGESGTSWSHNVRLQATRRPINTGPGNTFSAPAYAMAKHSKLNKFNREAQQELLKRLVEEASRSSKIDGRDIYEEDFEYDLNELGLILQQLDNDLAMKNFLMETMGEEPTSAAQTLLGETIRRIETREKLLERYPPQVLASCGYPGQSTKVTQPKSYMETVQRVNFKLNTQTAAYGTKNVSEDKKATSKKETHRSAPERPTRTSHVRSIDASTQREFKPREDDDDDAGSNVSFSSRGPVPPPTRSFDEGKTTKFPSAFGTKVKPVIPESKSGFEGFGSRFDYPTDMVSESLESQMKRFAELGKAAKPTHSADRTKQMGQTVRSVRDNASRLAPHDSDTSMKPPGLDDILNIATALADKDKETGTGESGFKPRSRRESESSIVPEEESKEKSDRETTTYQHRLRAERQARPDYGSPFHDQIKVPASVYSECSSGLTYSSSHTAPAHRVAGRQSDEIWKYMSSRLTKLNRTVGTCTTNAEATNPPHNWKPVGFVFVEPPQKSSLIALHQVVLCFLELVAHSADIPPLLPISDILAHGLIQAMVYAFENATSVASVRDVAIYFTHWVLRVRTVGDFLESITEFTNVGLQSAVDSAVVAFLEGDFADKWDDVLFPDRILPESDPTEPASSEDFVKLLIGKDCIRWENMLVSDGGSALNLNLFNPSIIKTVQPLTVKEEEKLSDTMFEEDEDVKVEDTQHSDTSGGSPSKSGDKTTGNDGSALHQ